MASLFAALIAVDGASRDSRPSGEEGLSSMPDVMKKAP